MAIDNVTTRSIYVGDVVVHLDSCSDAFYQLAAIFAAISKEQGKYHTSSLLACAGRQLADDWSNMADAMQEELGKNGVRTS